MNRNMNKTPIICEHEIMEQLWNYGIFEFSNYEIMELWNYGIIDLQIDLD